MEKRSSALTAFVLAGLLAGCAGRTPPPAEPPAEQDTAATDTYTYTPTPRYGMTDITWEPPLATSPEERAAYYVSRLSDPRFVAPGANGVRYVAAERLGEIGLPAVPLLLARLDTDDPFELMLALYALELSTQDPLLLSRTRGDHIALNGVLDPQTNDENLATARQWQQRHADALAL